MNTKQKLITNWKKLYELELVNHMKRLLVDLVVSTMPNDMVPFLQRVRQKLALPELGKNEHF